MSTTTISQPPGASTVDSADNRRKLEALCQLVELGQGNFVLALVEFDLPRRQNEVLNALRDRFPNLAVVTVSLTPPPSDAPRTLNVLDQLHELVKISSPNKVPEVLIITGFETLFPDALAATDGRSTEQLVRAIQPLNLGRNILAEKFPCPVLLCLPPMAMAVFLRSAPDLGSWQSGFFQFQSDLKAVGVELTQAAQAGTTWWARWRLRRREPEGLQAEAKHLEALIADAEALPADKGVTARLYERLGWVSVALGNRTQARSAFAEMLRLAREVDDPRLVGAAEKGQRAAERVTSAVRVSQEQAAAAQAVFRGAAALTEAEELYGHEEELRRLLRQVTFVGTRFLTVWGETGCGKTSLVLAGLVPELKWLGHYLPVVVRQWETPEPNVRRALEQTSGLSLESLTSLSACIQHVAQQMKKTVVVVCDQFEQFFTSHSQRSERLPFLKAIGACVKDYRVPCKFVFVMREDELGRMVEFDDDVPEPLEQRKRFYLPLFSAADAVRVLRQLSDKANVDWPEAFVHAVVTDLTKDGRVRPIELQLVGAALALSGISNELDYARAGRAQGLLVDYLQMVLNGLSRGKRSVQMMKRVLLTLVGEPAGRLTLTPQEIARRTGFSRDFVRQALDRITEVHLVRRVEESPSTEQPTDESIARYELTHDVLVDLVLILTRDLQDKRRQATRLLSRALEDVTVNPRHTIGLSDWSLVSKHSDESELANPKVKALLRRSFLWGAFKWFGLLPAVILLAFVVVQSTFGYVSLEQDFSDRVVVRRGLPWLAFLPIIGNDVVLDTGFNVGDFKRKERGEVQNLIHWEWGNQQSGVLEQTEFVGALGSATTQGILLCQTGQADRGISLLRKLLEDGEGDVRSDAAKALREVAQADPTLAGKVLKPLRAALKDRYDGYDNPRKEAVAALGQVVQSDPTLAGTVHDPLLEVLLGDRNFSVRWEAAKALREVAQADPTLANAIVERLLGDELNSRNFDALATAAEVLSQVAQATPKVALDPLLRALEDSDRFVRRAAAVALGQVARADPTLASTVLNPLLTALKRRDLDESATAALTQVAQANPTLALDPLLRALEDSDRVLRRAAAVALGHAAQADPTLASTILEPLLTALKDSDSFVRQAVAPALGQAAQADPTLASTILEPLLTALRDASMAWGTAVALGQVARADPTLASTVLNALLAWLADEADYVRGAAAAALGQVAQADPTLAPTVLKSLLTPLKDHENNVRRAAAAALGQVAQVDPGVREQAFQLLIDYDYNVRHDVQPPLADLLLVLTADEEKNRRDPAQFLLDHLEGRRSLMPNGNANTYAVYRNVVVRALALWLQSDKPEAQATQERLRQKLERMRDQDGRRHLRIAAWNVFVQAAELRKQGRGQS